jgi:hypothetical protein
MFSASLTHAAWNEYVDVRDLRLDANELSGLSIDAGAGSLTVSGDPANSEISVTATITVPGSNDEKSIRTIESDMTLELAREGDQAVLSSFFESGIWQWGDQPSIDLEVRVPERFALAIEDGSGSVVVRDVRGDIVVEDGSGSLSMNAVGGAVNVDDGSGSISIERAGGDVRIVDGSGSIDVRHVAGSVFVDDGSGGIDVSDVDQDLVIEDDGSGGLRYVRVLGRVDKPDE